MERERETRGEGKGRGAKAEAEKEKRVERETAEEQRRMERERNARRRKRPRSKGRGRERESAQRERGWKNRDGWQSKHKERAVEERRRAEEQKKREYEQRCAWLPSQQDPLCQVLNVPSQNMNLMTKTDLPAHWSMDTTPNSQTFSILNPLYQLNNAQPLSRMASTANFSMPILFLTSHYLGRHCFHWFTPYRQPNFLLKLRLAQMALISPPMTKS